MNTIELKIEKLYLDAKNRVYNAILFNYSTTHKIIDNDLSEFMDLSKTINDYIQIINNNSPSKKIHPDKTNSKTEVRG